MTKPDSDRFFYIVNAPTFDANSGGTIFLHELCHALNGFGETAYLWPMAPIFRQGIKSRVATFLKPPKYQRDQTLNTPMADKSMLSSDRAIMVYPEIVPDNPAGAKNIVRWLLYTPGDQHPYSFTDNEMFFRVFEKADMPELTGGADDLFLWKVNRSYRNENRPDRKGCCYITRKGHKKPRIPETEASDAIDIEGLSHEEINDVFNRCEVFYSYDEATMYSQFATICGCLSVIVPGEHNDRAEWARNHELGEFGVAYGQDPAELAHARSTRDDLIALLKRKEEAGLETVQNFIEKTQAHFKAR
jgi:hypothetical protein